MRPHLVSKITSALVLFAAFSLAAPELAAQQTTTSKTIAKRPIAKKGSAKTRLTRRKPRQRAQTVPTPARISEIQSALAAQGTYKGQPNGKWDNATAQAMKDYQSGHGLTPTGKLDALTLQKLGLGSEI